MIRGGTEKQRWVWLAAKEEGLVVGGTPRRARTRWRRIRGSNDAALSGRRGQDGGGSGSTPAIEGVVDLEENLQ